MALVAGTRLGPYEITGQIGQGGMGEVYRATDTHLNRPVAIKVLPEAFAQDRERLARFEREAKTLATLNHPNIAAIYGFEKSSGTHALVMELVEGPTLAERIARGPVPVDEALSIARQIAEGLEAAHEKGVVHRDLKPANIKVTSDDKVKILDFGLAKAFSGDTADASLSNSPTISMQATQQGVILGTAAYMSPEQARGHEVDKRTDIWAFGVVLWEMLTGKRLFTGETVTDILASVVKTEPEWRALPASTPRAIHRLLRRCLEKDRKRRLPDIGVARLEIDEALAAPEESSVTVAPGTKQRSVRAWIPWAAAAVLAVALAGVWWGGAFSPAEAEWTGVRLGGTEAAYLPRISPDGQLLAFLAMVDGITQVAVMKPDTGNYQVLTHDRSRGLVNTISWSPNSDRLYYDRFEDVPKGVYFVPVLGGEERLVLEGAGGPQVLPDGSLVLVQLDDKRRMQMYRYWPEDRRREPLALLGGKFTVARLRFRVASRANVVVFYGTLLDEPDAPEQLYVMDLDTGRPRALGVDADLGVYGVTPGVALAPDGNSVVFPLPSGDLQRIVSVPTDGSGIIQTLFSATELVNSVDVGPDGSIYVDQFDRPGEVLRIPVSGGAPESLGHVTPVITVHFGGTLPLPDGRVVANVRHRGRTQLIVLGSGLEPLPLLDTTEASDAPMALVGRDRMAFMIGQGDERMIALASIRDGRLLDRLAGTEGVAVDGIAASPDGQTLYYTASGSVWAIPVNGGSPPRELRSGDAVATDPNGKDLIVKLDETEGVRLVRVPLDGGPEQPIVVENGIRIAAGRLHPNAVGPDGKILLTVAPPTSWFYPAGLLDPKTGRVQIIDFGENVDTPAPGWTPDYRHIVAATFPMQSHLWRFRPEDGTE